MLWVMRGAAPGSKIEEGETRAAAQVLGMKMLPSLGVRTLEEIEDAIRDNRRESGRRRFSYWRTGCFSHHL